MRLPALLAVLLVATACGARYGVSSTTEQQWFTGARRSALEGGGVSDTTLDILRRRDLLGLLRTDPAKVNRVLDAEMRRTKRRALALAIAEISYSRMRLVVHPDREILGTTLRYSYAYMFDPELKPAASQFDIRFRWACDLYNRTLADMVRLRGQARSDLREIPISWAGGSSVLRRGRIELDEDVTEAESIHVAYDFEIRGLPPPRRFEGLGAPCIVIHRARDVEPDRDNGNRAERKGFAATLIVRFPDDCSILDDPAAPGTYEILDPIQTISVRMGGLDVPLEIDLTTPLVYTITQRKETNPGLKALFRSDEWATLGGLFPIQPLRKGRIPVILIHGLASDPFTWVPLYNDLMTDERIRSRFQFLVWFYPTGQPVMFSAAQLRERLTTLHARIQGESPDPALDSMVLCGHSLGGVLAHYLVIDSGTAFEDAVLRVPLSETSLSDADKQLVGGILSFEALPYVTRAIFYAAPHHGAPNARKGIFEWLAGFIKLPSYVSGTYGRIRPYVKPRLRKGRVTSLESLHPESPVVLTMSGIPIAPHIRYHSIIADEKAAGRTGGTDGFVPYASSHLDGAESELILRSGHSVQQTPLAAQETLRILLKHLAEFDAAQNKTGR